ncbi:ACHA6-like protein [Mya arenaria]|uniref:ACHA6-like protein n=1 Tax=Mya arenaria TaxID=6604 RepID=A0ABY7FH99_MYAAR|nr:ACHA6-like protein [Mya arenaria]
MERLILILFILSETFFNIHAQSGTDVNAVLTKLFVTDGYNKKIRPIKNQSLPVDIPTEFVLNNIIEFDEQNEALKTAGYLFLYWKDEYLAWNPSDFGGVEIIFVPQDDIWKPDVTLANSFKTFTGLGSSFLNVRLLFDGTIFWYPFQVLESTCSVDITYFPFDIQSCDLKFTAWSYEKDDVDLNLGSNGISLKDYTPNNQWDVVSTSSNEINTGESAVNFTIKMKRKPNFYILNIVAPVILLSLLNAFTFVLPVASGERAGYSVTVFLSLAVFLTIVASEMPNNSENTSIFSVYLMTMTTFSTLIVMLTLVEVRLSIRTIPDQPINKFYQVLYKLSLLLQCNGCRTRDKVVPLQNKDENPKDDTDVDENVYDLPANWHDVLDSIDFLLFWFFVIVTVIVTTACMLAARNGGIK